MTPYYQDGTVTLYHGRCEEVLPTLEPADLLLTDPPYGIAIDTDYSRIKPEKDFQRRHGSYAGKKHAPVAGDDAPFDPSPLLTSARYAVLWGANHYSDRLPVGHGWLVWDKRDGLNSNMFSDAEMAWTNITTPTRLYRHKWLGYMRASEIGKHLHPTQKPVALMSWVIGQFTQPGHLILDPYMGSGPVVAAAKLLGRRAIGIELEERYCEVAARRLSQSVMPLEAS